MLFRSERLQRELESTAEKAGRIEKVGPAEASEKQGEQEGNPNRADQGGGCQKGVRGV